MFFQYIVEPGRQTHGCNPRLEVLNLGLGTLNCGLECEEDPGGLMGLRSGTLLNCLFACCWLSDRVDFGEEEKLGSWGSGAFGAGGGGEERGAHPHCCCGYGAW